MFSGELYFSKAAEAHVESLRWCRDIDIAAIDDYFPVSPPFRSLKRKWDEVPRKLYMKAKIGIEPQLDLSELEDLVEIRNHLVHASISRPTQLGKKVTEETPASEILRQLKAGWALSIAVSLVKQLHTNLSTSPPDYLEHWIKKN